MAYKRLSAYQDDSPLIRGLGWFSLGLGLAELAAPGAVAALAGVPPRKALIRFMGLREIAAGIGIFSQRKPVGALWSRVAGDFMDLAALSAALLSRRSKKPLVFTAMASVIGVTVLDVLAGKRESRRFQAFYGPSGKSQSQHSPRDGSPITG